MLGEYSRVGILTEMIRKGTPVGSVDFASLIENPDLGALGDEYVRSVLGRKEAK